MANVKTQKKMPRKNRTRTYARNRRPISRRGNEVLLERDSTYFLKLIVVVVLGSFWLKFAVPIELGGVIINGVPAGLLLGLVLVSSVEKIQFDRKILYAILVLVAIVSYFLPMGIVL